MNTADNDTFYGEMASAYHLIFADWQKTIDRDVLQPATTGYYQPIVTVVRP